MKLFPWFLSMAFAVVCATAWAMSELVVRSLHDTAGNVPAFTRLVILPRHGWLLFAPVPWIVYAAALTFRRELTPGAVLVFAGTLFLFSAFVVCAVAVALSLPFIPLHLHAWRGRMPASNQITSLDAGTALCFNTARHWPGASEKL